MAHSKNKSRPFQHNGTFFLVEAKEACNRGVKASEGDFSWNTFEEIHTSIVKAYSKSHPGKEDIAQTRVTHNNYNWQLQLFYCG
jgi:hypothetical protein